MTIREKKQMQECVKLGLEEMGLPGAPFELFVITGSDSWVRIRHNVAGNMTPGREMRRLMKEGS